MKMTKKVANVFKRGMFYTFWGIEILRAFRNQFAAQEILKQIFIE